MPGVVEKTAYERQVFGQLSLRAPFQFDAEQFGGRAADVESARFERRPHPVGMAAGGALPAGCSFLRGSRGSFRRRRMPVLRSGAPARGASFRSVCVRGGAASRPRRGESPSQGRDLRGDEQRRAVPQPLLRGVLREGRAAPVAAVVGASAAIGGDAFRVAEAGGVFGGGKARRRIPRPYSGRMRSCGKISRFRGHRCAERKNYFPAFCLFRGKPLSLSPDLVFRFSCGGRNEKESGANPGQSRCCDAP